MTFKHIGYLYSITILCVAALAMYAIAVRGTFSTAFPACILAVGFIVQSLLLVVTNDMDSSEYFVPNIEGFKKFATTLIGPMLMAIGSIILSIVFYGGTLLLFFISVAMLLIGLIVIIINLGEIFNG